MTTLESDFRFDIDGLLSPISADNPAGESLRYDPVYDQIRALRREDDATLPQGVWKCEQKRADWPAVEALCLKLLETRSKDLQIASWLLEAWLKQYGFSGASVGFEVIHALCEKFWDELHSRIEDNDIEFRIAPLVWINQKISLELKLLAITAPDSDDISRFTWSDWEMACQAGNSDTRQDGTESSGVVTLARFQQSVLLTPTRQFHLLFAAVERLLLRCTQLDAFLDEKLGSESPGFVLVRNVGEAIAAFATGVIRQRGEVAHPSSRKHEEFMAESSMDHPEQINRFPLSRIRTRAEAYQVLAEVADFLVRSEPHSPVPYLISRAVAWGSMPLQELLADLVRNAGELTEIYKLLDLQPLQSHK
jgi:type VI secretion system ImpA family protein